MSAVAPLPSTPGASLLSALVAGKIVSKARSFKTQDGRIFLTLLKLAAPDEFTSPGTIELRSRAQLGEVGDIWRGKVRITGFGRSFASKRTDPETGEVETTQVRTAENRLDVIEA